MTPNAALFYWLTRAVVTAFLMTAALFALFYAGSRIARRLQQKLSQRAPD